LIKFMPSPLQDLYKSVNDLPILTYPDDLGSSRKGHYISFTVMVPQKSNYIANPSSPVSITPPSSISGSIASTMNSIGNAATQAASAASSISSVASAVTDTIGSVASVANQAVSAVNSVVGTASSVVGSVAGIAGVAATAGGSVIGGVTAATVGISAATNIASGIGDTLDSVGQFISDPTKAISGVYDSVKNYLNGVDNALSSAEAAIEGFMDNSAETLYSPATSKIQGFINLYMPDTVNMNQQADYADISVTEATGKLGMGQEVISQGKNYSSLLDSAKEAIGSSSGLSQTIRNVGAAAPPVATEILGNVSSELGVTGGGFTQYMLGQKNTAINPQMEVLFTSINFRTFQFDFTFTPKSPEEAATVREIIKMFRYHSAPEIDNSGTGRYFIVPSVFNIEYRYLEQRNENLHKFAPCALTSVMVDYAPEVGWVAHNDGMPVKTRVTLQFKEMEILTKERISEGY
jgi:hypothetical protein